MPSKTAVRRLDLIGVAIGQTSGSSPPVAVTAPGPGCSVRCDRDSDRTTPTACPAGRRASKKRRVAQIIKMVARPQVSRAAEEPVAGDVLGLVPVLGRDHIQPA